MLKGILLIAVIYIIWIVLAIRAAPEVDDNGNIINKKNKK
jgi:hypothetical protein